MHTYIHVSIQREKKICVSIRHTFSVCVGDGIQETDVFGNMQLDQDLDRNREIIRILGKNEHKGMLHISLACGRRQVVDQKGSTYLGIPDFERETRVGRGASLDIKRKIKLHRNHKNRKGRARTASRVINKVRKKNIMSVWVVGHHKILTFLQKTFESALKCSRYRNTLPQGHLPFSPLAFPRLKH